MSFIPITVGRPTIDPEHQKKIIKLSRMLAAILHRTTPERPRDEILGELIGHAREALGNKPSEPMFRPSPVDFPGARVRKGEPLATLPGMIRVVIADYDWTNPQVAESIMVLIQRSAKEELGRPVPGEGIDFNSGNDLH